MPYKLIDLVKFSNIVKKVLLRRDICFTFQLKSKNFSNTYEISKNVVKETNN